jgi:hypothetical protein
LSNKGLNENKMRDYSKEISCTIPRASGDLPKTETPARVHNPKDYG